MILRTILLILLLGVAAAAQQDHYILYSLHTDVNGDGVPERMMVRSTTSQDPNKESPKDFVICEKRGDKYVPVFRKSFGNNARFYSGVAKFQWQDPGVSFAGITVKPAYDNPKGPPEIWVVFAPSSGDFLTYRFNGVNYEELRFGD